MSEDITTPDIDTDPKYARKEAYNRRAPEFAARSAERNIQSVEGLRTFQLDGVAFDLAQSTPRTEESPDQPDPLVFSTLADHANQRYDGLFGNYRVYKPEQVGMFQRHAGGLIYLDGTAHLHYAIATKKVLDTLESAGYRLQPDAREIPEWEEVKPDTKGITHAYPLAADYAPLDPELNEEWTQLREEGLRELAIEQKGPLH